MQTERDLREELEMNSNNLREVNICLQTPKHACLQMVLFVLHNFPYAECSAMFCIPFTFLEMTFEL